MRGLLLTLLLAASPAFARVIPIAPYAWGAGTPITQRPGARHLVGWIAQGSEYHLAVRDPAGEAAPWFLPDPPGITVQRGGAAYEQADGTFRLLEWWTSSTGGHVYVYSADSGATWTPVPWSAIDPGPRGVHTGSSAMPFVLVLGTPRGIRYYGLRVDGTPVFLAYCEEEARFIGSDATGSRLLIAGRWWAPAEGVSGSGPNPSNSSFSAGILDLSGRVEVVGPLGYPFPNVDGWITPQGSVYLNFHYDDTHRWVRFYQAGVGLWLAASELAIAAPTADFSGAWIATWKGGQIVLRRHTSAAGLIERWRVPSSAPLAAFSSGRAAERVLLATSRDRGDTHVWGLAAWEEGEPAPSSFDDVILNGNGSGVVRFDADEVARRGAVLLYSGVSYSNSCPGWCQPEPDPIGLVRVALKQRLVIPAAAHARGAHGADWRTDLIVRNPEARAVDLTVRFLRNPDTASAAPDATLTLQPNETRLVPDVLATLFHLESGSGALLLVPAGNARIRAASRTHTRTERGTHGMSVDGVDAENAAWVNLPRTIAAGLLGTGFRSNFVAADVSGNGTQVDVVAPPAAPLAASVEVNAQVQLNDLAKLTGAAASDTRSLVLTPHAGAAVPGLIAIDDRTNDPSWFGADAIAGNWIFPALVHGDGIGGAKWRTDLYLYNPHTDARRIVVSSAGLTLGPGESRVVRDFYGSLGFTGVGSGEVRSFGVQVASRVYAENPDGSTYGTVVPPLDEIERAYGYWRETLEIVGPVGGAGFRTNLVILQLGFLDSPYIGSARVQILDGSGAELDAFDVQLREYGRLQIDDLFRNRGLGDGPEVAVIRVNPSVGAFAAYATTIDNGTNDASYFAGALGSH